MTTDLDEIKELLSDSERFAAAGNGGSSCSSMLDQMNAACATLLSHIDAQRNEVIEECKAHIRASCRVCAGTGNADHDPYLPDGDNMECEYCGRPMDALRALKSKSSEGEA